MTLTSAAQIQRFIQTEKKMGQPVQEDRKVQILDRCIGQSKRTVEKILFSEASAPTQQAMKERVRTVDETHVELKFRIGGETQKKLDELKNLLGADTLESIFDRALETLLQSERKKRGQTPKEVTETKRTDSPTHEARSTLPAVQPKHSDSRFIPIGFKRAIFLRSGGQCEYIESRSGKRCLSRYRLQIDHRFPLALGGRTELPNLRHLCPNHNLRAAIEAGLKPSP